MGFNETGPATQSEQIETPRTPENKNEHEALQVSVFTDQAEKTHNHLKLLIATHPNLEESEKGKLWERIQKMVEKEVERNMEQLSQFNAQDETAFREAFFEVRDTIQYFVESVGTGVEASLEVASDYCMITDDEFQELYESLWFLKPLEIKGDESQQALLQRKENWRMGRLKSGELAQNSAADLREYAENSAITGSIGRVRETTSVAQITKEELTDIGEEIKSILIPEGEALALATIIDEFAADSGAALRRNPEKYQQLLDLANRTGNPLDIKVAEGNKPFNETFKDNWKGAVMMIVAFIPAEMVAGKALGSLGRLMIKDGKFIPSSELIEGLKKTLGKPFQKVIDMAPSSDALGNLIKTSLLTRFPGLLQAGIGAAKKVGREMSKNLIESDIKNEFAISSGAKKEGEDKSI